MNPADIPFFSPDYATARARFLAACATVSASVTEIQHVGLTPSGDRLITDIAWIGSSRASRVLLVSSGLHGVEGFAGSAIQLQILAALPVLSDTAALVLVHCLNPWGMSRFRRVNENNVDLNRNLLAPGEPWSGAPEGYTRLAAFLNPASPPSSDAFMARAMVQVLRYGFGRLKEAVLVGQYEYPQGLFFGGASLQPELRRFTEWLSESLSDIDYLLAVDLHTGIGPRARDTLFLTSSNAPNDTDRLGLALGRPLVTGGNPQAVSYPVRGAVAAGCVRLLPDVRVDFITQDFGTVHPLAALAALRKENRAYHYGGRETGKTHAPASLGLCDAFCPRSPRWRRAVLARADQSMRQAVAWVCDQ